MEERRPNRRLSQRYLDSMAERIDHHCIACYRSSTDKKVEVHRDFVKKTLDRLDEEWQSVGIDAGKDIEAFKTSCDDCFADGRQLPNLKARFSCAIRQRLPEEKD